MDIGEMLSKAAKDGKVKVMEERPTRKNRFSPEIEFEMLTSEAKKILEKDVFIVGDVLVWKSDALAHNTMPNKDRKMVVIEVLENPIRSLAPETNGSPYYGELQDIRAMVIGFEGEALCYLFDSSRFKKVGNIYEGKIGKNKARTKNLGK